MSRCEDNAPTSQHQNDDYLKLCIQWIEELEQLDDTRPIKNSLNNHMSYFTKTLIKYFPIVDLDKPTEAELKAILSSKLTTYLNFVNEEKLSITQCTDILIALNDTQRILPCYTKFLSPLIERIIQTWLLKDHEASLLALPAVTVKTTTPTDSVPASRDIPGGTFTADVTPALALSKRCAPTAQLYRLTPAICFYHLCKLLKSNRAYVNVFLKFDHTAVESKILAILGLLQQSHVDSQAINNTFLSLGYLAQHRITYDIPEKTITTLLEILCKEHLNELDISHTFLGLAYLAQEGKKYDIHKDTIATLFQKLCEATPSADAISIIFLALRYFAQQGKTYDIPEKTITTLLEILCNQNPTARIISNILLSLGYLAQKGKKYNIPDTTIARLLKILCNQNPNKQEISNFFLGVGYLAQQGITYKLSNSTIATLLEILCEATPCARTIAITFLALGYLAQQGKTYDIPDKTIATLLEKLNNAQQLLTEDISYIFFALGFIVQQESTAAVALKIPQTGDSEQGGAPPEPGAEAKKPVHWIHELLKRFLNINVKRLDARNIHQVLVSSYQLRVFGQMTFDETAQQAIQTLESQLANKDKPKASPVQKLVYRFLVQNLSIQVYLESLVCGYFVDILIPNAKLIIEIDGEQHYDKNGALCSADCLRDQLLQKAGHTVVRITNSDAQKMLSDNMAWPDAIQRLLTPGDRCETSSGTGSPSKSASASNNPIVSPQGNTPTQLGFFQKPKPKPKNNPHKGPPWKTVRA